MAEFEERVVCGCECLVGEGVTPAQQVWAVNMHRLAEVNADARYGIVVAASHRNARSARSVVIRRFLSSRATVSPLPVASLEMVETSRESADAKRRIRRQRFLAVLSIAQPCHT